MDSITIQDIRKRLNLTQARFGELFGVHPMTVSKWERGELEPSKYQETLMKEFSKAAKDKQVRDTLTSVLIGMGVVAALLLLLNATRK